jgi:hypothetical protein
VGSFAAAEPGESAARAQPENEETSIQVEGPLSLPYELPQ